MKWNNRNHEVARVEYPHVELIYILGIHPFHGVIVHVRPPCGLRRFEQVQDSIREVGLTDICALALAMPKTENPLILSESMGTD